MPLPSITKTFLDDYLQTKFYLEKRFILDIYKIKKTILKYVNVGQPKLIFNVAEIVFWELAKIPTTFVLRKEKELRFRNNDI